MTTTRHTAEYFAWRSMLYRCRNSKDKKYYLYGGRGISVCERWAGENGFDHFLSDMGPRPSGGYSLDRINTNGNYEPGNCRWATIYEQNRNRRNNRIVTVDGVSKTLAEWCSELGVPDTTVGTRATRNGSSFEAEIAHLLVAGFRPRTNRLPREVILEIRRASADGETSKSIARRLHVSPTTVRQTALGRWHADIT